MREAECTTNKEFSKLFTIMITIIIKMTQFLSYSLLPPNTSRVCKPSVHLHHQQCGSRVVHESRRHASHRLAPQLLERQRAHTHLAALEELNILATQMPVLPTLFTFVQPRKFQQAFVENSLLRCSICPYIPHTL